MPCCSIGGFIPVVHPGAFVYPAAACCVGPNASLRGDFGRIVMLFGANVQDSCAMHGFPGQERVGLRKRTHRRRGCAAQLYRVPGCAGEGPNNSPPMTDYSPIRKPVDGLLLTREF